jgi:hypothetical protein
MSMSGRAIRRYDVGPDRGPTKEATPVRYLLLIYQEPSVLPRNEAEFATMATEYGAYGRWLADTGQLLGGEALKSVSDATTVAVRDGRRVITDGPYAETKEILGGYYLIDSPDLDAAIEAAARIPGAKTGRVEIRPIMEMP